MSKAFVFAASGVLLLAAGYVALAPVGPLTGSDQVIRILSALDAGALELAGIAGRIAAVLALAFVGVVLALVAAMAGRKSKVDGLTSSVAAIDAEQPRPAWRPDPHSPEDRIASLRRRALADGQPVSATVPEPVRLPASSPGAVIVIRKPRMRDREWFEDRSWLGGLPRLGNARWPRGADGVPLPFAAQIDMAQVAEACPGIPLPTTGALAFFLGAGAVVPVDAGVHEFSEPPADLPPAFDEGGAPLPAVPSRMSRHFFPFWPVALAPLDQLADQLSPRDEPFAAEDGMVWWYGARHLADRLNHAFAETSRLLASRGEQSDRAELEVEQEGLRAVIAAMEEFTAARDPWQPLSDDEASVVADLLSEIHATYGEVVQRNVPRSPRELETLSLRAMITGAPEALAALPDKHLTRINSEFRVPLKHHHQILAHGNNRSAPSGDIVLLQLACDDMMEWRWPDTGMFQFRIAREALIAGQWDAARLGFSSGQMPSEP